MAAADHQQIGALDGTKQQILDVARHLFSDRSYLGVSMSEIAARLGITKAALYYHFSGKREIYEDVLEEALADLHGLLEADGEPFAPGERLRYMVGRYLEFGIREKNLINALVTKLSPAESGLRAFVCAARDDIVDRFRRAIDDALASSRLLGVIDSRLAATMLTAMMDGLIVGHSFLERTLDPDRVSREIVAILGLDAERPATP